MSYSCVVPTAGAGCFRGDSTPPVRDPRGLLFTKEELIKEREEAVLMETESKTEQVFSNAIVKLLRFFSDLDD
jgi:hypothetical protein